MQILEKIDSDMKDAMRAKDDVRLSVLRMLRAALRNKEIEKRGAGEDAGALIEEEVLGVIRTESKKRKDAAEGFRAGGREESAQGELAELEVLAEYLPQEVEDEEIERVVRAVIAEAGEVSMKEFGRIMGSSMKKLAGGASGDRVSAVVKKILNEGQ